MKKYVSALPFFFVACIIAGCASKPIPEWRYESFGQLENYKINYLKSKDQVAEFHYRKTLEEVKRSGDLKLIAKVYLTKYALKAAVLEDVADSDYLDMDVIEPDKENRNFFVFLQGNLSIVDAKLLPAQYGPFLKAALGGKEREVNDAVSKIDDSLSCLIAIGITVKKNLYNEETLQTAVNTASANGWQKPLLAHLGKLEQYYEATNEKAKASKIRQKIKAIKN
ncbi:MAG: hypothetical protein JW943_13445 [Deltaproteobacteria bacterium]|nr:hypothetical protein [Deltaproteobacteria bacterium]